MDAATSTAQIDSELLAILPYIENLIKFVEPYPKLSRLRTFKIGQLFESLQANPFPSTLTQLRTQTGFPKFAEALVACEASRDLLRKYPPVKVVIPFKDDLVECAQHGSVEKFEDLLQQVPEDFLRTFESEEEGLSLLHYACRAGNVPIIRYILGSGFPIDHQSRLHGSGMLTPLMEAVRAKKEKAVLLLLTYGAKIPKLRSAENKSVMDYATDEMKEKIREHVLLLRSGKIPIPQLPKPRPRASLPVPLAKPINLLQQNLPIAGSSANAAQGGQVKIPSAIQPPYMYQQMAMAQDGSMKSNMMRQLQSAQFVPQTQGTLPAFSNGLPPGPYPSQSLPRMPYPYYAGHSMPSTTPTGPQPVTRAQGWPSPPAQIPTQPPPLTEQERKRQQARASFASSLDRSTAKSPQLSQAPTAAGSRKDTRDLPSQNASSRPSSSQSEPRSNQRYAKNNNRLLKDFHAPRPSSSSALPNSYPAHQIGSTAESSFSSPPMMQQQANALPMPYPTIPMPVPVPLAPNMAQAAPMMNPLPMPPQMMPMMEMAPHSAVMIDFVGSGDMFSAHPDFQSLPANELVHELWNLVESLREDKAKVDDILARKAETESKALQQVQNAVSPFECPCCYEDMGDLYAMTACGHLRPCDNCVNKSPEFAQTCIVCKKPSSAHLRIYIN